MAKAAGMRQHLPAIPDLGPATPAVARCWGRAEGGGGASGVGPPEAIITRDLTLSGRIRVRAVPRAHPYPWQTTTQARAVSKPLLSTLTLRKTKIKLIKITSR